MAIKWSVPKLEPVEQKNFSLSLELSKLIGGWEAQRTHKVVHASDITKSDFCPRRYRLLDLSNKEPKGRYLSPELKATFDQGHMMSDLVRQQWAGDKTVGHWKCHRCDAKAQFQQQPEKGCPQGQKCDWRYDEIDFQHPEFGFSGSLDMLYVYNPMALTVVEIKTIKPEEFNKLVAPKAEHRVRTKIYLRLVAESDSPFRHRIDTTKAKVLYVSRGFGQKNPEAKDQILPFKDFEVLRDDPETEEYVQRAKVVMIARQQNTVPPGVCPTPMCQTAKSCEVIKECFSGKYPAVA